MANEQEVKVEQTSRNEELESIFSFLEDHKSEEKKDDSKTDSDKTSEKEVKDEVPKKEGEEKKVDDVEKEELIEGDEEEVDEEETEEDTEEEIVESEEKDNEKEKAMLQAIAELKDEIKKLKGEKELEKNKEKPKEKEVYEFIKKDEDFDEIINDRRKFNSLLSDIYNLAQETITASIPSVVARTVQEQVATGTAMNRFLSENKDLFEENIPSGKDPNEIKMKRWSWLQKKMTELQTEDPSLSSDPYKLISRAGDELRELMGQLKNKNKEKEKKTIEKTTEKKRRPFPGKSGVRSEVKSGNEKKGTDAASMFEDLAPFVTR